MYYVYEWYNKNTGEIFYVGKGTGNRFKVRKHNNKFNDYIRNNECESRIVKTFKNEESAFSYEFDRILELKSKGQCMCNIRMGGNGGTTKWWTEERRKEYSINNVMKSEWQRKRMSENNPMKNPDVAKKNNEQKKVKICIGDKVYPGIVDVARAYNIAPTAIQYWLERGYSNDLKPCYYYGKPEPEVVLRDNSNNCKPVIVDGVRFRSVKDASKSINVDPSVLIKTLKSNKPCKGHICSYENQQPSQDMSMN